MPPDKDFKGSPNFMVVKFCPISVLCCMLRINNVIFLDPYIYSKQNENAREMALLTPITYIELPAIGNEKGTKEEDYIDTQFCSFFSVTLNIYGSTTLLCMQAMQPITERTRAAWKR